MVSGFHSFLHWQKVWETPISTNKSWAWRYRPHSSYMESINRMITVEARGIVLVRKVREAFL
jgi:hypothetical protein